MRTPERPSVTAALLLAGVTLLGACGGGGSSGPTSDLPTTATLAFTAPNRSIDLANYTLAEKHDLPVGAGVNLLASEASAVTYDPDTDTLFVVGDGGTSVVQVSKTGVLIDSMQLAQDPGGPQNTYFYDTEGITYVGNGQFVFVEERHRQVDRFTYQAGTILGAAGAQAVKLGTTIGNVGIEGLSYDPFSGGFVFVKEKTPIGVFQSDVNFGGGTATNGSAATVDSVNLFDPALLGVIDLADVYSVSNVLAPQAPDYDNLLILSQESARILLTDRAGAISSRLDFPLSTQTEGLTLDQNRILYLVNELGGGAAHPQLWVYKPTTGTNDVGIGSRLYVTFDKTVLAGTGNIVLDGGPGDVRTIDVTDASQVTIAGKTLALDLTTDLLAGKVYAVTAAAGVLKSASGVPVPALSTLGVATTFTTATDVIAPTLEATTPLDDASGITSSHVLLTFTEPVRAGTGQIVLHSTALSDDRVISVTDLTQVTFGGNVVDVNPSADLLPGTTYFVTVEATAIVDLSGNPYAGIATATTLNFTTAGNAPATPLVAGDLLFVAVNGDDPADDAFAFVLLKAVSTGTQICFSDKDWTVAAGWPAGEAVMTWTANRNYPAGTIVTIRVQSVQADKGTISGTGGGISTSAETYFAFIGTTTPTVTSDHFLATMNSGGAAAGDIPAEVSAAGTNLTTTKDNAKYVGSWDESDLAALSVRIKDVATNWVGNDTTVYALLSNGSIFATPLAVNDLLFMGMNGSDTDAFAFVLLKAVSAGTQVCFTDKNFNALGAPAWPTNEAAFTWTADVAYPLGTVVTIQPGTLASNKGSAVGASGGVGASGETYYAFVGTIADPSAGDLVADTFLASINVGGAAAGDIPAALTGAGTALTLAAPNVKYAGSMVTSDPSFPAWVKDTATWATNLAAGFPLTGGDLFP